MADLLGLLGDYGSDQEEDQIEVEKIEEDVKSESHQEKMELQETPFLSTMEVKAEPNNNNVTSKHPLVDALPGPSPLPPNPKLLELLEQHRRDPQFDLIQNIVSNKAFGNPSLLSKIVDHFGIHETGTNLPASVYGTSYPHPKQKN